MASIGLKHRLEAVLSHRSVEFEEERRLLVLEFLRLVIQVLARSELSRAEREALEMGLVSHLDVDIETVRDLVDIAFRPEFRAVVDQHEIFAFGSRFGEKLVEQMQDTQSDLPTLTDFARRFGGDQALLLMDTVAAVSGADGRIDTTEIQRIRLAATELGVDDVLVSALLLKHDPRYLEDQMVVPLDDTRIVLGRAPTCDVCLPDPQVAMRHAELIYRDDGWRLVDLASGRPTLINGVTVQSAPIDESVEIRIGSYRMRLDEGRLHIRMERSFSSLSIRNLSRRIGDVQLLDDVSLTVFTGEVVAVIGPSGCGKTTLLNAINGVTPADEGRVLLDGRDFHQLLADDRSLVGIVPQDDLVNPELTVEESLMYSGRLRMGGEVSNPELARQVDRVVEELDIRHIRRSRIGDALRRGISGGQRKRVNLGQELMTESTRILFLDEPMSGLDPRASQDIMSLTRQLADRGRMVFLVTHDLTSQVMAQVDHLLVLAPGGRLAYFGPPSEACRWFGVATPDAIFNRFGDRSPQEWGEAFKESSDARRFVRTREHLLGLEGVETDSETQARQSGHAGLRHFRTLVRRYLKVKLRDRMGVAVLAVQPAILALVMWLVFPAPTQTALFMLSLGALWFGMSASVRELIADRVIFRREHRVGVGVVPYLASKIVVMGALVSIQAIVLSWGVFVLLNMAEYGFVLTVLMEVCVVTAFMGMALGFLVSSIFDSSEAAVGSIPLLLIPQIALSGIMLDIRDMTPLAKLFTWLNIERYSFDAVIKSGTHVAYFDIVKEDAEPASAFVQWLYTRYPWLGDNTVFYPVLQDSKKHVLSVLGFRPTGIDVDPNDLGLQLGHLVQIMNGFSGFFLICTLTLVAWKTRRDN